MHRSSQVGRIPSLYSASDPHSSQHHPPPRSSQDEISALKTRHVEAVARLTILSARCDKQQTILRAVREGHESRAELDGLLQANSNKVAAAAAAVLAPAAPVVASPVVASPVVSLAAVIEDDDFAAAEAEAETASPAVAGATPRAALKSRLAGLDGAIAPLGISVQAGVPEAEHVAALLVRAVLPRLEGLVRGRDGFVDIPAIGLGDVGKDPPSGWVLHLRNEGAGDSGGIFAR